MPVKSKTDPIVKTIKGLITQYKPSVDTHRYGTGSTQTITFNGGVGQYIEAGDSIIKIIYTTTRKHSSGIIGYICRGEYPAGDKKTSKSNGLLNNLV